MKFYFFILFNCIGLISYGQQSAGELVPFSTTIKDIKFDSIAVSRFLDQGDAYTIYALAFRDGGVRTPRTLGFDDTKDPVRIKAFVKLDFDKDLNLKGEALDFLVPNGFEETKNISILDGPGGLMKNPETLAIADDVLDKRELIRKYPEAFSYEKKEKEEKEMLPLYYENHVQYGGGFRVKGLVSKKQRLREKVEKTKADILFNPLKGAMAEVDPYKTTKTEIEIDYPEQSKKSYWRWNGSNNGYCDKLTGRVYAHFQRVEDGDKTIKHFKQELATFDKDGTILNRVPLQHERPLNFASIMSVEDEDGLEFVVFKLVESKKALKKMGLEYNKKMNYFYILDKNGELVQEVISEINNAAALDNIIEVDGKFIFFGVGFNVFSIESYTLANNEVVQSTILKKGTAEFERLSPMGAAKFVQEIDNKETSVTMLGQYIDEPRSGSTMDKTTNYGTYFVLNYDKDGKLSDFNSIPRPANIVDTEMPSYTVLEEDDETIIILTFFNIIGKNPTWKGLHPTIATIRKADLDVQTTTIDSTYKLSSDKSFVWKEDSILFLVQDLENKYSFFQVKL